MEQERELQREADGEGMLLGHTTGARGRDAEGGGEEDLDVHGTLAEAKQKQADALQEQVRSAVRCHALRCSVAVCSPAAAVMQAGKRRMRHGGRGASTELLSAFAAVVPRAAEVSGAGGGGAVRQGGGRERQGCAGRGVAHL